MTPPDPSIVHPVLDLAGAAGVVAGTAKMSKFIFDFLRDPLRTNIVRLYVFAVSLIYVYAFQWLNGNLVTGPDWAGAYATSLLVAGLAIGGYHLLKGDWDTATGETWQDQPVSQGQPIAVKRSTADVLNSRSSSIPIDDEPDRVPEWEIPAPTPTDEQQTAVHPIFQVPPVQPTSDTPAPVAAKPVSSTQVPAAPPTPTSSGKPVSSIQVPTAAPTQQEDGS